MQDRKNRADNCLLSALIFSFNPISINTKPCLLSIMELIIFTSVNGKFTKVWIGLIINNSSLLIFNYMCHSRYLFFENIATCNQMFLRCSQIHLRKAFAFTFFNFFVTLSIYWFIAAFFFKGFCYLCFDTCISDFPLLPLFIESSHRRIPVFLVRWQQINHLPFWGRERVHNFLTFFDSPSFFCCFDISNSSSIDTTPTVIS